MLLARQKKITFIILIKETNLNATYHHSPLFNNSKYNKNIIGFFGLFIIGMLAYIMFGVNILIRQGWMKELHGSMDLFVHYCIWPVVLPKVIYTKYSKQFKCNSYFYVSGQSRPFWAALKLL